MSWMLVEEGSGEGCREHEDSWGEGLIYPVPKPSKRRKSQHRVTKDNRVILKGSAKSDLREDLYERSGGFCEIRKVCGGLGRYAPLVGHPLEIGHVCHWPPKKMGNSEGSDTPETTLWGCRDCHDWLDNRNQKVVPAK